MNQITEMFDSEAELDTKLAFASEVLTKVAEEQGVDLDLYTEEEKQALLLEIMGGASSEGAPVVTTETPKVASTEEEPAPVGLNPALVALELTKQAAAEGIDLSTLTEEQYAACYNEVATSMQDPQYAEKQAAEQQAQEEFQKAASIMEELGRISARGFVDELNKLAGEDEGSKDPADREEEPKKAPPMAAKKDKGCDDEKKEASAKLASAVASLKAKTAGAQRVAEDVEAQALKIAHAVVRAQGYDPTTGEKLATVDPAVARAQQILKESGW